MKIYPLVHRFQITGTLNGGEYQPFFTHYPGGLHPGGRRSTGYTAWALPPPLLGAGWGDGGERSVGDGTKARYDLLIWNRCTRRGALSVSTQTPGKFRRIIAPILR